MILNVATSTANTMLDSVAGLLEKAHLEFLTDDGELLAVLGIFDPGAAIDKELVFQVADGNAVSSGNAAFARAVAADGSEVFSCDVGTSDSNAVIKLSPTEITRGEVVKLSQFRLIMP